MFHGHFFLQFNGHAVFKHSITKGGNFNIINSLDNFQVTTLYGAFLQCASMMEYDLSVLNRISVTPPRSKFHVKRNMLIHTAPLSPFDWQPKWIGKDKEGKDKYDQNLRVFPRKIFALWKPQYQIHVFAEDDEAKSFVDRSWRILSDRANGMIGANLGLGYKKKLFGVFKVSGGWEPLLPAKVEKTRVCEVFSDCPTRFNAVIPLLVETRTLMYRNIHPPRGIPATCSSTVYAPESKVILKKQEATVNWFQYNDELLGISDLVDTRHYADTEVKAIQGLFLTHP